MCFGEVKGKGNTGIIQYSTMPIGRFLLSRKSIKNYYYDRYYNILHLEQIFNNNDALVSYLLLFSAYLKS